MTEDVISLAVDEIRRRTRRFKFFGRIGGDEIHSACGRVLAEERALRTP